MGFTQRFRTSFRKRCVKKSLAFCIRWKWQSKVKTTTVPDRRWSPSFSSINDNKLWRMHSRKFVFDQSKEFRR